MHTSLKSLLFLPLASLACSGRIHHGSGEFSLSGGQDVTGSQINTYVTDSGEVLQPVDLSATPIAAFVIDESGKFAVYPGVGASDGTFSVPGVPPGPYTLKVGQQYFVLEARNIDLGTTIRGRPNRVPATISPTDLILDLSNIRPWRPTDVFVYTCTGVGIFGNVFPTSGAPAVGDTATDGLTFDYTRFSFPQPFLIDGDQNDRLILIQYEAGPGPDDVRVQRAAAVTTAPPFSQIDGNSTRIAATMSPVPENERLALRWSQSSFAAFRPLVNPRAEMPPTPGAVIAASQPSHPGTALSPANLFNVTPMTAADMNFRVLYGSPYPNDWSSLVQVQELFRLTYQLEGSTQPFFATPVFVQTHELQTVDSNWIFPITGPIRNPTIDGADAFEDQTDISATPTLRWDGPPTGPPSDYRVVVNELFVDPVAQFTSSRLVATLTTQDTSLTIPPNVLSSGSSYYFRIRSLKVPAFDRARPLALVTQPNAVFEVYTNKVSIR